jgi:hypothetical protein
VELSHARAIVQAADDLGIEAKLREEYSGRGMYGKCTAGIVVSDLTSIIAAAAQAGRDMDDDEAADFIDALDKLKTDGMGRSIIVY